MKARKWMASLVTGALLVAAAAPVWAAETVPGAVYGASKGLQRALEVVAEQAKDEILKNLEKQGVTGAEAQKIAQEQVQVEVRKEAFKKLESKGIKDVKVDDWSAVSIAIVVESGLIQPDAAGQLKPKSSIKANDGIAAFAKVLGVASKEDDPDTATQKAQQAGLVSSTPTVDQPLSRLDTALLLANALGVEAAESVTVEEMPFDDAANIPIRYWGVMKKLFELGIFKGFPNEGGKPIFGGAGELTVEQIATLIDRVIGTL